MYLKRILPLLFFRACILFVIAKPHAFLLLDCSGAFFITIPLHIGLRVQDV